MVLTTLGLMSRIQVNPVCFFQIICFEFLTSSTFLLFFQLVFVHISQMSKKLLFIG